MIEYYSVRDSNNNEVIAFDTLFEANEYCRDRLDDDLRIVKIIM